MNFVSLGENTIISVLYNVVVPEVARQQGGERGGGGEECALPRRREGLSSNLFCCFVASKINYKTKIVLAYCLYHLLIAFAGPT